ncbi:MAG: hypothetical protein RLZZ175_2646 [Bacteroidota bacterium]|jgi:hypothetical protein
MKSSERPYIEINTTLSGEIEHFQSDTLRPILKLQNELLLSLFKHQTLTTKVSIKNIDETQILPFIDTTIKKDISFKSIFIGTIIAHFNEYELEYYLFNKQEINKRIISMLIERVRSQWQKIV